MIVYLRQHTGRLRWIWATLAAAVVLIAVVLVIELHSRSTTQTAALSLKGRWVPTALQSEITALLPLPNQPSTLLAATTNGMWRSVDSGVTWQQDGTGLQKNQVFVLADTTNSDAVWAGSFDGSIYVRSQSASKQVQWRRISPVLYSDPSYGAVPIFSLAVLPQSGHPVLAGSEGQIFRGEPDSNGSTWQWQRVWQWQKTAGAGPGSGSVTSLLVAPGNSHQILGSLFTANPPVVASNDGGETWTSDGTGLPTTLPVQNLEIGAAGTQQVFLTTMGGGVWQQAKGGTWSDVTAGLPQRHAMPLLAASPASSGVLFAGTMGTGVYEKVANGAWHLLGQGLSGSSATVMSLTETAGPHPVLLAGTTAGLYRYQPAG